jgi:hypothetical protein
MTLIARLWLTMAPTASADPGVDLAGPITPGQSAGVAGPQQSSPRSRRR